MECWKYFGFRSSDGKTVRIGYLPADYPLTSSRYYASKMNDKYVLASARLQEILGSVTTAAITADLWTSQASHSYLSITKHFLVVNLDGLTYAMV